MKKVAMIMILALSITVAISAAAQQVPVWKTADLKAAIDTAKGPTIINFWATFCKPCIAELPYSQALANQYRSRGVSLIMVSLDLKEAYPKTVAAFVRKRKLTSPVFFLDETNADIFVPAVDSTWSGAIPASLFINPAKGYRKFMEEELSREKLEEEIKRMLEPVD